MTKRLQHVQMQDLKEALISEDSKTVIVDNFLQSFLKERFPSQASNQAADLENGIKESKKGKYSPPKRVQPEETDPKQKAIDFYKENRELFPHGRKSKEEDSYAFFKQASAKHPIPTTQIINFAFQKSDPTQFATVTRASKFFKDETLQLKEIMCLQDYKALEKIRVRNYIYILRMITQVDKSDNMYQQVKRRLNQIRRLCTYIELSSEDDYEKLMERLGENKQIHDLEDSEDEDDDKKSEGKAKDFQDYEPSQESDEDGYNNNSDEEGEDAEYQNFFKSSNLNISDESENYLQALLNEEKKWVVRAAWLETTISSFNENPETKSWVGWFVAKLEQLQDLDVPVQGDKENVQPNSQVFYLHLFLDEYIQEQKKKETSYKDEYLKDEYTKDQQVYIDEQNTYPKVKFDSNQAQNNQYAGISARHNIREKLCLKIQRKEEQTDYFLTVYKRRAFGNEKIYEKRLNFKGRLITVNKLEFHPKGSFIYIDLTTSKPTNRKPYKYEPDGQEEEEQSNQDNEDSQKSEEEEEEEKEDNGDDENEEEQQEDQNEEESYDSKYQNFQLIFPIEAQFKNPLLLKTNSNFLGFYGEKNFYAYQFINEVTLQKTQATKDKTATPEGEIPTEDAPGPTDGETLKEEEPQAEGEKEQSEDGEKKEESEEEEETAKSLRVYEYDLHNFSKVRAIDLMKDYAQVGSQDFKSGLFGKTRDGFYLIKKKNSEVKDSKEYTYIIMKGKDTFAIKLSDSKHKFVSNDKADEYLSLNEKGDKLMIIYKFEEYYYFARLVLDVKTKTFKQDNTDFKSINQNFPTDDANGWYQFRIVPTLNDFIILASNTKKNDCPVFIFQNEVFLTKVAANVTDLHFNVVENQIQNIYEVKDDKYLKNVQISNIFLYNVWDQVGDKKEWYGQSHEIINEQRIVSFPYVFFIYNHDQLYMKDLTCHGNEGFFYLNNFFGIDSRSRPLTVQVYNYWNKMCVNVPIVESKYTPNQFGLRVHQLITLPELSHPYKLTNTLLNYKIYGFNEQLMSQVNYWAQIITNADGNLDKDIRISFKGNCLRIEKWDKNKCVSRVLVTHYHQQKETEERDVSNPKSVAATNQTITYKDQTYRLIVIQKAEGVAVYTMDLWDSDSYFDFADQNALEPIYEYADDESTNPIIDIIIDTLAKRKVDIYIVHQNSQMKKIEATVPFGDVDGQVITFQEYSYTYNMDTIYQEKTSSGGRTPSQGDNKKKLRLYENFIANQVFYSSCTTIDLTSKDDPQKSIKTVDLRAEVYENKMQKGIDIASPFPDILVKYQSYSFNEARLICIVQEDSDSEYNTPLVEKLIVMPLLNSRILPQFYHGRFKHPVVPLVDKEQGFTTVFTLNTNNTINSEQDQNTPNDYYYNEPVLLNHENSKSHMWQKNFNNNPGMLVRYFNGIEQNIPIKEKFLRIDRFVMSKEGYHILIVGLKLSISSHNKELVQVDEGMYLYRIDKENTRKIELAERFLFATKEIQNDIKEEQKEEEEEDDKVIKLGDAEIPDFYLDEYPEDEEAETQKFHGEVTQMDYNEELEIQQSDEEEEVVQPLPKQKSVLDVFNNSQPIIDPLPKAKDEDKPKPPKIQNLNQLFYGFDIPYYEDRDDIKEILEDFVDSRYLKEGDVEYQINKSSLQENNFTDDEKERIKKIHSNMHLSINESGHIFLINRLSDKLYFFYPDNNGTYRVHKQVFYDKLAIIGADSSGDYMTVWNSKQFKVFNISSLFKEEPVDNNNHYAITTNGNVYTEARPKNTRRIIEVLMIEDILKQQQLLLAAKRKSKEQAEQIDVDEYVLKIQDIQLYQNKMLIKIEEEESENTYMKIFDFVKQTLQNYIEYDQLMVSGDKQYIWFINQNKVYDIQNNLSTLFIWPGGQLNTHAYDSMDIFNVSNDKTIMAAQGYLQLSFSFLSAQMDASIEDGGIEVAFLDVEQPPKNYHSRPIELCYKLSSTKSVLYYLFNQEVSQEDLSKSVTQKDKDLENESEQQALLQKLVNYISRNFVAEKDDPRQYTEFFLSHYSQDDQSEFFNGKDNTSKQEIASVQNIFQILFKHQQPRYDIIEEVLRFVVKSVDLPITQLVINKNFVEFLRTADTSIAFREYLEKGIVQTAKMETIEKYPIIQTDQMYKLDCYQSPIMDEGFNRKFQDMKESKKDVQIQYIFLGNLLEEKGEEIMREISKERFLTLMNIPFVKYLVLFQWNAIQSTIKAQTLYPFYSLLVLYSYYAITFVDYVTKVPLDPSAPVVPTEEDEQTIIGGVVQYIVMIALFINIAYFLQVEARQCYLDYKGYFSSFWNLTDLISYSLCLAVVIFDVTGITEDVLRPVSSIALIILWIKLFYFLRIYDSTSQLIRMIIEVGNDMKNFLFVLSIGIIGFSGGLYIMQFGLSGRLETEKEMENNEFVGGNFFKAFIYTYRMTLGDFQLDAFSMFDEKGLIFEYYFLWFIFICGSLFLVIVLLNLLIAIMGATFGTVMEKLGNLIIREKVLLVSENETLFNRESLFKNAQYLIIITQKQIGGSTEDSNEAQINELKTQLGEKVSSLENELKSQMTESQKELKRKFFEQEEKSKKSSAASEQRYDENLKGSLQDTISKITDMFTTQQHQIIKIQSQVGNVNDQVKQMTLLQDQVEKMKSDQSKLTKNLYRHFKIEVKANENEDEE